MSYLVSLALDVKPDSQDKYEAIKEILTNSGLFTYIKTSSGKQIDLPNNTYIGEFEGENSAKIRTDIATTIENEFKSKEISAQFFLTVGSGWAWSSRLT